MEHPLFPFAFDDVVAEAVENEDDLYDSALAEYPGFSAIGPDQEQQVPVRPRPPLPITPPIWSQVSHLFFRKMGIISSVAVPTGSVRVP
jgi:hypothetical protein